MRRFELFLEAIRVAYSATAFSASYLECLANCSELVEDADRVLGALHRKYRIAVLTNGLKEVQRGRLARSVIRHHVSDIIISEEIGAAKPARAFFDTAFARLGHPSKREVLMIGDGGTRTSRARSSMALTPVGITRAASPDPPVARLPARSLRCVS